MFKKATKKDDIKQIQDGLIGYKEKIKTMKKEIAPQPPKERTEVVDKLPLQEVRQYSEEDGTIVNLMLVEEALTAIMNS